MTELTVPQGGCCPAPVQLQTSSELEYVPPRPAKQMRMDVLGKARRECLSLEGGSNERSCSHRDLKVQLQKSRNCMRSSSLLTSRMWLSIRELDCSRVRGILVRFLDEKNYKIAFAHIFLYEKQWYVYY